MAQIYIRGIGQKEVSNEDAKVIKQQWESGTLKHDEIISFGNFATKAGSITGITLEPEIKSGNNSEQVEGDYYKERHEILSSSLEERAHRLEFFKLLIKIMDDRDPTEEELEKAKQIQLEFFQKNPYRLECDTSCFKEFTNGRVAKQGRFVHLIERIIGTDIYYQKYKMCTTSAMS